MRTFSRRNLRDLVWAAALGLALSGFARAAAPAASIESDHPVLLVFHADWCSVCRQMAPTVDALASAGYEVERIDVDRNRELAARFQVATLPCFIVVERGKELDRVVGRTSLDRLRVLLRPRTPISTGVNKQDPPERRPHPAWRYEKAVGYRAAVVRIFCQDDQRLRSIGSGTLVKWAVQQTAEKIVVLTARHVIADAKQIVVETFTKKTYKARVLKVDAVWDCAVLALDREPEGVAADVELGDEAMQQPGNRLESCGYGPDGKLAVNTGLFLGYKRSTQTPNGPDDWFEISGHARPGDSGGGVFNQRGRLVGLLWGTDGEVVVGVQAGRIHLLLDAATCGAVDSRSGVSPLSTGESLPAAAKTTRRDAASTTTPLQFLTRQPTPPACEGSGCCPVPGPVVEQSAAPTVAKKPLLPWRDEAQARDAELDARTERLLQAIAAERQARIAGQQTTAPASEPAQPKPEPAAGESSPLVAMLTIAASLAVGGFFYAKTRRRSS